MARWVCKQGHEFDEITVGSTKCPICGFSLHEQPASNGPLPEKPPADLNATIDSPGASSNDSPQPPTVDDDLKDGMIFPAPSTKRSLPSFSSLGDSSLIRNLEVPGYDILSELGRGGMGVVYKARQKGLNRIVALKMILAAEHAGADQKHRFIAEAESVAQLHHPHIVQIYEIGEIGGRPYFSLEYVDGGSLAQKLQGQPQSPRSSAALIETLAKAVAAANAIGIIHRDLKPANVLLANPLTTVDVSLRSYTSVALQAQHPFGIPKITDFGLAKRLESGTGQTQTGSIMGTPSYMAPEQASGKVKEICPATDVYSLGAILYELLTGRPPFVADNPVEIIMKVIRDEPVAPSKLQPKIPRDLEIITLKCLEKSISKRYANGIELADDLTRFLEGEPISARPATKGEKVRKWARRNPLKTLGIGIGFLASLVFVIGVWIYQTQLESALNSAITEKQNNLRLAIQLTVDNGIQLINSKENDLLRSLPWFAEALRLEGTVSGSEEMHRIRIASVLRRCPRLLQAWFHEGRVNDAHFSQDGRFVVTACEDGFARIFNIDDIHANAPTHQFKHDGGVSQVRFSPNGNQILTVCSDRRVRVWKFDQENSLTTIREEPILTLPQELVTITEQKPITMIEHEGKITSACFDPSGNRILSTSEDRTAKITHLEAKTKPIDSIKHTEAVLHGEFSPDGQSIATACSDGTARVWNAQTGQPISAVLAHQGPVVCVRFSPDSNRLLTASKDRSAKVWNWRQESPKPFSTIMRSSPLTDAAYSLSGRDVMMASEDGTARIWNMEINDWRTHVVTHGSQIQDVEISPDGRSMATGSDDNTARVWDVRLGDKLPLTPPLPHNGAVYRTIFSPDGSMLLTASQDGIVRLWEIISGRKEELAPDTKKIYSPDRRLVIKFLQEDSKYQVQVFDAATDREVSVPIAHKGPILHAAFSPDGNKVLTTSSDRTARIWDSRSVNSIGEEMRHGSDILFGTFSPDGQFVATCGKDNMARIWNAQTGKAMTDPLSHKGTVKRVVFSPDGRCLLTQSDDGTVGVWDSFTGRSLMPFQKPTGWIARVISASELTTGWELPPDQRSSEQLRLLAQWLSSHQIDIRDNRGGLVPLDMQALRETWNKIRRNHPPEFTKLRKEKDHLEWHRQEAESAENAREWFAAAFHLTYLIKKENDPKLTEGSANPKLSQLYARRGRAYAEQREWEQAANDFLQAQVFGADDEWLLSATALTHLAMNNQEGDEGYQEACDRLMKIYGGSAHGESAARLTWICLLAPESHCCIKDILELGKKASLEKPDHPGWLIAWGASSARKGDYKDAIAKLSEGQVLAEPLDSVRAWLYLAMICRKLDRPEESTRWLKQAEIWIKRNAMVDPKTLAIKPPNLPWYHRLELELLYAEMDKLTKEPVRHQRMEKIN